MSITLDVNAFLNSQDVAASSNRMSDNAVADGTGGGGDIADIAAVANGSNGQAAELYDHEIPMEKEVDGNIFEEIEHLLKFNKNLEFAATPKDKRAKHKKPEDTKKQESLSLDFLNFHTDDLLLASDTHSLLGEDSLLFSVEKDRLQPLTSKFMVPGIYKRIEGVERINSGKQQPPKTNVIITNTEKNGCILSLKEFDRLYELVGNTPKSIVRRYLVVEPLEENEPKAAATDAIDPSANKNDQENCTQQHQLLKDCDVLGRLAYNILKLTNRDHIVIDRKRNEIIRTQYRTNQKTIYRFWEPEMLDLKRQESEEVDMKYSQDMKAKFKSKKGRPRKEPHEKVVKKKKPNEMVQEKYVNTKSAVQKCQPLESPKPQTTRSGRVVRNPNGEQKQQAGPATPETFDNILQDLKDASYYCNKVNKTIKPTEELTNPIPIAAVVPAPAPAVLPIAVPLANCIAAGPLADSIPTVESNTPKRKVPPESICPTCHKIFLGRRLQRHFAQHPDHIKVPTTESIPPPATAVTNPTNNQEQSTLMQNAEEPSLFRFLVTKLQKSHQLNEDQKADLFLAELNDLVEQLQLRSSRLIRNTSGLHTVNQRCAKLLGIPEGQYALDLAAIEAPLEPEMQEPNNQIASSNAIPGHLHGRSLDYNNLSITLDDALTDEAAQKLNLSAGGKILPPSEESLLRAVDDLVQTDMSKIPAPNDCLNVASLATVANAGSTVVANLLPPHIDHVSDNAVEAVHMKETPATVVATAENPLLDLSVDFFQFNN